MKNLFSRFFSCELLAAVFCFIIIFIKILVDNASYLTEDLLVYSDAAADILITHRIRESILLVGHYNFNGVNHLGPFFLYIRYFTEVLAGSLVGSIFGAHLLAMIITNASFFGLLAALLTRLAGGGVNGAIAGVTATFVVLLQFVGREWAASTFMSFVIIAPFFAFLAAAVLLLQGSLFGLISAAFVGLILIHAYIPLAPIAVLVFLLCLVLGRRERKRGLGKDFPVAAYWAVAALIIFFAAPVILDIFLFPPGNLVKILNFLIKSSAEPLAPVNYLFIFFVRVFFSIKLPLLMFIVFGIFITIYTGRYCLLFRRMAVVVAAVIGPAIIIFARAPVAPQEYQGTFLIGPLAIAVAFGCMICVLELERINPKLSIAALTASVLFPVLFCSLESPNEKWIVPQLGEFSRKIEEQNAIYGEKTTVSIRAGKGIVAGLLLDLDKKGINICHPEKKLEYFFSYKHICPEGSEDKIPSYEVAHVLPCVNPQKEKLPSPQEILARGLSPLGMAVTEKIDAILFQPLGLSLVRFLRAPVPQSIDQQVKYCEGVGPAKKEALVQICISPRQCLALMRRDDTP